MNIVITYLFGLKMFNRYLNNYKRMKIEKLFATYEISKELKELGFDEETVGCFDEDRILLLELCQKIDIEELYAYNMLLVPTWSHVIDWFVEKHNIWIVVDVSPIKFYEDEVLQPVKYQFVIEDLNDRDGDYLFHSADADLFYFDHKEARIQAILSAIEILKEKKDV